MTFRRRLCPRACSWILLLLLGGLGAAGALAGDTTGVFRSSTGAIFLKFSNDGSYVDLAIAYGMPGDRPVVGDWDGDGRDTIGVFRRGVFHLRNSNTPGYAEVAAGYGSEADLPVAGDWDGDGRDTIGVFRAGAFFLRNSNTSGYSDLVVIFGAAGDIPLAGDWDGDGRVTIGVYRPSDGAFYLRNSLSDGIADVTVAWGGAGDQPVVGDWDGNRTTTFGLRNGQGDFRLRNSNSAGPADLAFSLGAAEDVPLSGSWNGAGVTPAPAPTPTPTPESVPIYPGQSLRAAVLSNPAGTTFIIKAGTHYQQSVIPKSGNSFIGEPGAVLDGQSITRYAFSRGPAPYPSNVTIRGLQIINYNPASLSGTIDAGGYYPNEGTTGWVIDSNEVAYNGEYGIRFGNSTRVTNNYVHHNRRLNVCGSANNTLVEGNEISFGNYQNSLNTNFEAGGTKFGYTDGLVLRNNFIHDNQGVGLHMDENNINTLIEGNRVVNNSSEGIVVEICYATRIINNTVTGNGWRDPRNRYSYLWNAGIGIHASPDVEVAGNTVSGNYAGIVAIQQDRSADRALYGPHVVQNLYVHDNIITQTNLPRSGNELSVAAGLAQDVGDIGLFINRNNRFVNNRYILGSNPRPFAWMDGARMEAEWQSSGQDVPGIFGR